MSINKKIFITVLMSVIIFLTGSFFTADCLNYIHKLGLFYPYYPKLFLSLIVAVIAWSIGKDQLDERDQRLVQIYSMLIFPGDICMFLVAGWVDTPVETVAMAVGYVLFFAAHVLMSYRFGSKLAAWYREQGKKFPWYSALFFYVPSTVVFLFMAPSLVKVGLLWPGIFYNYCIVTPLWLAWLAKYKGCYPETNGWFIAAGYTAFYICEVLGGIFNGHPKTDIALFVLCFIWLFYGPGILLVALSGYRWGRPTVVMKKEKAKQLQEAR